MHTRILFPFAGLAAGVALLAAACGGTAAGNPPHAAAPPPKPLVGESASATLGEILIDAKGRTLYHFLPEQGGTVACSGQCAQVWVPVLVSGGAAPTHDPNLPGTVGTVSRPDGGTQATYDRWPLYTFSGDKAAGDTAGQGVLGKWFVQPAVEPAPTPTPTATPAPTPAPVAANPPAPAPTQPAAVAPAPPPAPPLRTFNDGDSDNRGGPSDGDGNG